MLPSRDMVTDLFVDVVSDLSDESAREQDAAACLPAAMTQELILSRGSGRSYTVELRQWRQIRHAALARRSSAPAVTLRQGPEPGPGAGNKLENPLIMKSGA
eukprot:747034-Hanusia_phi.AAC.1